MNIKERFERLAQMAIAARNCRTILQTDMSSIPHSAPRWPSGAFLELFAGVGISMMCEEESGELSWSMEVHYDFAPGPEDHLDELTQIKAAFPLLVWACGFSPCSIVNIADSTQFNLPISGWGVLAEIQENPDYILTNDIQLSEDDKRILKAMRKYAHEHPVIDNRVEAEGLDATKMYEYMAFVGKFNVMYSRLIRKNTRYSLLNIYRRDFEGCPSQEVVHKVGHYLGLSADRIYTVQLHRIHDRECVGVVYREHGAMGFANGWFARYICQPNHVPADALPYFPHAVTPGYKPVTAPPATSEPSQSTQAQMAQAMLKALRPPSDVPEKSGKSITKEEMEAMIKSGKAVPVTGKILKNIMKGPFGDSIMEGVDQFRKHN